MEILGLLTGRGGSSLKNKNIIKILNKPVLAYPCLEAKKIKKIKYFYVSSDDKNILNTASKYGFNKLLRPKKYSRSDSSHHDVLIHAIKELKKKKIFPDIIVVLLANAPIIKQKWINDCISMLLKKNLSAVVPVLQDNDKHPFRAKKIDKGILKPFIKIKKKISTNRQQLKKSFYLCHNFWVIKTKEIMKNTGYQPWSFMGKQVAPYQIKISHDIHDDLDIKICEYILRENKF